MPPQSTTQAASDVDAIDVHAHFGTYANRADQLGNQFMSGEPNWVLKLARVARTQWTCVSPLRALMPRGHGDALAGNVDAATAVAETPGLLQWVVIDPRVPASYEQAATMLTGPRCVGIKIHPEEHLYPIAEYGRSLFEFAAARACVILTHSGEQNSRPGDFVEFANDFPSVRLILAHLGNGHDSDLTHQVRAIQASRHGNVFTDTSSAASLMPRLIEWGVSEVGADRILYGTDSPLYFAPMQRARIDQADISDLQKRMILRENALRLFQHLELDHAA